MHNILDFSKPLALQLSHEYFNETLQRSLITVAETAKKKKVIIESLLSPDLPAVSFDALRMEQVIINLAVNAVQALPEGKKVSIRTSMVEKNIVIDVTDCGSGISLDHRAKVFDPFFTTKKEGTGLGLAILKKLWRRIRDRWELQITLPKGLFSGSCCPGAEKKLAQTNK